MARVKLSDDLKAALKVLPSKEKDKLIFRMLPKDQKLIHQLEFKLLENSETTDERRDEVRAYINSNCEKYPEKYYSPTYLIYNLKDCSGRINYHTAITKDKIGEIELNLLMLNEILGRNVNHLSDEDRWDSHKLADYVVARIKKLHKLIGALHEDYLLEFEDDINTLKGIVDKLPFITNAAETSDIELALLK